MASLRFTPVSAGGGRVSRRLRRLASALGAAPAPGAQSRPCTRRGPAVPHSDEPKIAVALKYAKEVDNAPKVVAKGMLTRAEKILEIAKKSGVPVMRNVPLAHALNRLEVGDEIPEELYDAVAEILNYVFELSRQESGR